MAWEPAERVQKNSAGEYRALIGGEWVPVEKAQKNSAGVYRVERSSAPKQPTIDAEWKKKMDAANVSAGRAEHPVQAKIADVATGMSGSLRGIANLAEKGYKKVTGQSEDTLSSLVTGEKPTPLGEKIWPKAPGSEGTGAKLAGSLLDPVPWLVAGGIGKVAPYAKVGGSGFLKGLQATGRNILSGATTGGIIGGLSDEGTAASGAAVGGVVSGALPLAGALGKSVISPITKSGRVELAKRYFKELLGPARAQVAAALANPSEIISGSPTTAADRIAAANVGQTDKFGSALVKSQDILATQPEKGIADVAKSIAAQQETARAAELGTVAQTPSALASAVAGRKAASTANYPQAFGQHIGIDNELMSMSENPYFRGALADATRVANARAQRTGKPLDLTEQLHLLKLSLDKKMARTGDTALSSTEKMEVTKLQDQLVSWLGKKNPAYETARAAHEAASRPINQMKVGQDLQRAITAPVSGAERAASFGNALRTAENKVSASTGRTRIADLTPQQLASVKRVEAELARNAERDALASGVNPKNLFNIAERGKGAFHIPNLLSRPAMATNWLMKQFGNSADDLIAQDVGMMLQKDPAGFAAKYLQDVPPTQRQVVMAALRQKLMATVPPVVAQNGE